MMDGARFFGTIPEENLVLSPNEVALRLKTSRGYTDEIIRKCEANLRKVLDCRYAGTRVALSYPRENVMDFGFCTVESKALYQNLGGCKEAFLVAVTIGHGADRLTGKLSVTSTAEHFITDGLGSAFAEAACDCAEKLIKGDIRCKRRFSPGYADLALDIQPKLLEAVDAGRLLNIRLGKTLLMSPCKSITAIMGIEDEQS